MKRFRTVLFWCHLALGVTAGLTILVMSVTGALLAFQPQILAVLERQVRRVPVKEPGLARVRIDTMVAAAARYKPDALPTGLTLESGADRAAAIAFGRDGTVYVDPYTGKVLGEGASRARATFQAMTEWHRWLGQDGPWRSTARAITGASNFAFLGLAVSGLYLWWPRKWSRSRVKAVTMFDGQARGKARDFNWHNVIGFWCAPVLIVLTATAVVMSYPWANDLLYRLAGSTPPSAAAAGGPGGAPGGGRGGRQARGDRDGEQSRGPRSESETPAARQPFLAAENLDLLWTRAEAQMPTWGSIAMRIAPRPGSNVSFTLTDAAHWNRFARSQLTLDAVTGAVVRWEPYVDTSLGQKARGWVRFGHTGELAGWPGQLVAGIACVGGSFLVWTGLSLALRRLVGWRVWKGWVAGADLGTATRRAAGLRETTLEERRYEQEGVR